LYSGGLYGNNTRGLLRLRNRDYPRRDLSPRFVEVDTVILITIGNKPSVRVEKVSDMEDFLETGGPVPSEILTITGKALSNGTGTMFGNNRSVIDLAI